MAQASVDVGLYCGRLYFRKSYYCSSSPSCPQPFAMNLVEEKCESRRDFDRQRSYSSSLSSSPALTMSASQQVHPPEWVPDEECSSCMICGENFGFWLRKHHCRMCGSVCCHDCSRWKLQLPQMGYGNKDQRVCQPCWSVHCAAESEFGLSQSEASMSYSLQKDSLFNV